MRFFLRGFVGTAAFGIFRSLISRKGEMWVQHKMMQYTDDLWKLVKELPRVSTLLKCHSKLEVFLVSVDIRSPRHSQQRGFTSLCSFSTAIIYYIKISG